MAEFVLKYADPRGEMHQQVAEAGSEREMRDRFSQQGFLIYSVKPRREIAGLAIGGGKKKINLEKFLIFNQQFVTLIRAGLPILKALDLLSERLTDAKLAPHIKAVREEVKNGSLLSDAFARQGVFRPSMSPRYWQARRAARWARCWTALSLIRNWRWQCGRS